MRIRSHIGILAAALLLGGGAALVIQAQEAGAGPSITESEFVKHKLSSQTSETPDVNSVAKTPEDTRMRLAERFMKDQKEIWTSPAKLRFSDTEWLVPLSGFTAGLFVTDREFNRHISKNPATIRHYTTLSNAGVAALAGGAGGIWLWSHASHNEHWQETGFLAGEAALNSLVVVEGMKYSLQRERPFEGGGSGRFFQSGGTSFPSEHAAAAWSVAGVLAHEYPGPFTKVMAYGLASLVSYSRVRGQKHFPSDVFAGTVIGNLVGQEIYRRHHDPELGGAEWRSIQHTVFGDGNSSPGNQGSPMVPLDSWVYPLFDRLVALGYVKTGSAGQRPWTRLACAGLVEEALEYSENGGRSTPAAEEMLSVLAKEFSRDTELLRGGENRGAHLESAYSRVTGISGKPLTDSDHFGQTISNDFGRPFQEGVNNVTGTSGWMTGGRWVAYVRGEYQFSPSGPAYSDAVRNFIASIDLNPVQPARPVPVHSQFQLLDAYVGFALSDWQLSYGQQSFWWGPGRMGPFLYSDNAVPARVMQLKRVAPFHLPWLFRYMGPVYLDAFFGNLDGRHFPPNAVFHGEKISFKPTENLELGFSRTVVLGGTGHPVIA